MRKIIFTLMLCFISVMSFAQQEKGTFALQPKAGVNVSTIGSGTTCIAALMENRHYIGIEKEETYYNIAKRRIEEAERQLRQ